MQGKVGWYLWCQNSSSSQVVFISQVSATWLSRARQNLTIFSEKLLCDWTIGKDLCPHDKLDHGLCQLSQNITKNLGNESIIRFLCVLRGCSSSWPLWHLATQLKGFCTSDSQSGPRLWLVILKGRERCPTITVTLYCLWLIVQRTGMAIIRSS